MGIWPLNEGRVSYESRRSGDLGRWAAPCYNMFNVATKGAKLQSKIEIP